MLIAEELKLTWPAKPFVVITVTKRHDQPNKDHMTTRVKTSEFGDTWVRILDHMHEDIKFATKLESYMNVHFLLYIYSLFQ